MDKWQALHVFWNSFNIPAYDENTVPESATLPYIAYEVSIPSDFLQTVTLSASIFYRDTSWSAISQKASEIADYIGYGGRTVKYDGGVAWIKRSATFAQRMAGEIDTVRRMVLTIEIDFISD